MPQERSIGAFKVGDKPPFGSIGGELPQNGLRNELSDGKIEKARKEKTNVEVVCRWPVSNGEV